MAPSRFQCTSTACRALWFCEECVPLHSSHPGAPFKRRPSLAFLSTVLRNRQLQLQSAVHRSDVVPTLDPDAELRLPTVGIHSLKIPYGDLKSLCERLSSSGSRGPHWGTTEPNVPMQTMRPRIRRAHECMCSLRRPGFPGREL